MKKDVIWRIVGLLAIAITFVPAYYAKDMVGDCIDPIRWKTPHTHPEMIFNLMWIIGAFPLILFSVRHGLFLNTEKGLPSWPRAFACALFCLLPAATMYADDLIFGCPYAIEVQHYVLTCVVTTALCSLILYIYSRKK